MSRTLASLILLLLPLPLLADNWPAWRGPNNNGVSSEKSFPLSWSKTKNVRWQVALQGAGVSNPIVWQDRVFLTASDGRLNDRLHVYCYNRSDGRLLWHTRLFGSSPTDLYAAGGMAVPTPLTDGKSVYVLFGTGELAALDFDGKPVWIRSLAQEYGPFRNRFGMGSSPILVNETLIIQVDHFSQSYLLAVDRQTGANRWKTDRPASVNWTTPLAVKVKDKVEIVTYGTNFVRSYDVDNGKELWHVAGLNFQCVSSPVVLGNLLFACGSDSTLAIKVDGGRGDLSKTNVVWKNKKAVTFVPSPLLYQDHLYVTADRSFASCYDAKTGVQVWKERLGDQFYSSPVGGAGRIYFATLEGTVKVVRAGPKFELLADNQLGETIVASPALSNGQIFLRGEKHLFCIEDQKGE